MTPSLTLTMAYVGNKGTYTLGDGSGNTTNPNEAAIELPGSLSFNGQSLHWDPSVKGSTPSARRRNGRLQPAAPVLWLDSPGLQRRKLRHAYRPQYSPGQCGWTSDITYYSDNLNTNFNAAQVTLAQNLLKGLDYTANYQWASALLK